MPDLNTIPVFPLPVVVFPDEEIRLHIFEPRYKELIKDCSKSNIVFGIIPVIYQQLMDTGTLVLLQEIVKTYPDGRMDVILKSDVAFKVQQFIEFYPGKLYSAASVQLLEFEGNYDAKCVNEINRLFNELCELNDVRPLHSINWDSFKSCKLAHYVGFSLEEEYEFLKLSTETARIARLVVQLNQMIANSKIRLDWTKRLSLNGEFRNFKEF